MTKTTRSDHDAAPITDTSRSLKGANDGVVHQFLQSRWDERKVTTVVLGAVVVFIATCFVVGSGIFH